MAGFGELPKTMSYTKPPGFNGENYTFWKLRMRGFLEAIDIDLLDVIDHGPFVPTKDDDKGVKIPKLKEEWDDNDKKKLQLNAKAKLILNCSLSQDEYFRVSNCVSAKEIWDSLEISHEGTAGVRKTKINMLTQQYEMFRMKPGELIKDMQMRFTHIINHLTALGKTYSADDLVSKVLRSLPMQWQAKVTAIEESNGESLKSLAALFGNLQEYEIKLQQLQTFEEEDKKQKSLSLKATSSSQQEESDEENSNSISEGFELNEENLGLFVKKFNKFFNNRKGKRREPPTCFECRKTGHIKWDCPQYLKKQEDRKGKEKTKAYISSIWGESDDEEEAHICLMAKGDDEVTNLSPSYDELLDAFEEMHRETTRIAKAFSQARKENLGLKEQINILKKESSILVETNLDLEKEAIVLKDENISLENEILALKENIALIKDNACSPCNKCEELKKEKEDLTSTLTKFTNGSKNLDTMLGKRICVFDKAGIGYNSVSKQKHYKNFFVPAMMSENPSTTCFYCKRKGHISQNCRYKKSNSRPKMVWVPKEQSNLKGPKKIWVPKKKD